MNHDALKRLGQTAAAWAEAYVKVVEELVARGVPDAEAREAATNAANHAALADYYEAKDADPWEGEL